MKILVTLIYGIAVSGCVSSQRGISKLDADKDSHSESKQNTDNAVKHKPSPNLNIDWQSYFKPAPSPKEKQLIEEMLESEKTPNNYDDLMKRGFKQLRIGMTKDAEISFRQANRINENMLEPMLEIARIHLSRHELTECLEYLAHIKESLDRMEEPDEEFIFKYRYLVGLTKIREGDLDFGRKILRELISIQPDFAPGYVSLAMTYIDEQNTGAAEFIIRRGMDLSPKNADFFVVLGAIALQKQRSSVATRYFNKALELDENNVAALINRGTIAISNMEYERAELDVKKALAIEITNDKGFIALAIIQKRTGRVSQAKATLEKAIELNPTAALARFHLAELYLDQLDDPEYALQLFYEVLQTKTSRQRLKEQAEVNIEKIKRSRL